MLGGLGGGLAADGDDEVFGGDFSCVLEAVHDVRGGEDDASGTYALGFAVVEELDSALADHEELGVAVAVGGVGHGSGQECGLVEFDLFARGEDPLDYLVAGPVGGVTDGKLVEGEGSRGGEDLLAERRGELCLGFGQGSGLFAGLGTSLAADFGSSLGVTGGEKRKGWEGYTEVAAVEIFHGDHAI